MMKGGDWMKRFVSLMAVFACLAFVVNSFSADAKKDDKKPAAGKDGGKKAGEKKDDVFFAPKSGKAYHCKKDCGALKKAGKVESCSKADAEKKGLKPCKMCCGEKKGGDKKKGADKKAGGKKDDKK